MYTKKDLIDHLTKNAGSEASYTSRAEAERAINNVLDGIKTLIGEESSEGVGLTGFGTFAKVRRPARMGRNPKTGESIQIAASTNVKFKISKNFKDSLK